MDKQETKLSKAEEDFQEDRIKECRIAVMRVHFKWMGEAIIAMRLVKTYAVPTMAVDQYWRCYWNPTMVATWTNQEINGVLIHEVIHLLRRHATRSLPMHDVWNIAADLEINDNIVADKNSEVKLPGFVCMPSKYKMKDGLIAEEYYELLIKQMQFKGGKSKQGQGNPQGGQDGNGEEGDKPSYGGGSGSDGQQKEWEDGISGEKGNNAISEIEAELIREQIAKNIKSGQYPGNISAGMQRWADDTLEPKVDWRKQMRNVISRSLDFIRGQLFKSMRVPSRRQGELIFPGTVQPNPKVCVIVDTSGSMDDELLSMCLAEIKGLLRVIKNVTYVSGDTSTCTKGKVNSAKSVKLGGGGGTDMGRLIEENMEGQDLIIVLTDGYTDWCNPVRPSVVACIVSGSSEFNYTPPPEWIKTVYVKES